MQTPLHAHPALPFREKEEGGGRSTLSRRLHFVVKLNEGPTNREQRNLGGGTVFEGFSPLLLLLLLLGGTLRGSRKKAAKFVKARDTSQDEFSGRRGRALFN